MKHNSIRIAYYHKGENIPNGFLDKAFANKYNYILGDFGFHSGVSDPMNTMKTEIKNAFIKVNSKKMRLIPCIGMGSKWALDWDNLNNPDLTMQTITADVINGTDTTLNKTFGCHSFSEEPDGIDKSFKELLQKIKEAYQESNVSYPLEFIHIGHDEPSFFDICLIGVYRDSLNGYVTLHPTKPIKIKITTFSRCKSDYDSVNHLYRQNGNNLNNAFLELYVNEINRRIQQTHEILGQNVKIMIYGDAWDPQKFGTLEMENFKVYQRLKFIPSRTPAPNEGIASLNFMGWTDQQKQYFKDNIILMPWNYHDRVWAWHDTTTWIYDASITFNYLKKNGFKFIYVHEIGGTGIGGKPQDRVDQAEEWYNNSKDDLYRDNCLGYDAAHWASDWTQGQPFSHQPACFKTMNHLYDQHKDDLPANCYSIKTKK